MVLSHSFIVFFFQTYGDPRDLHVLTHSVPTRRASDLSQVGRSGCWTARPRSWPVGWLILKTAWCGSSPARRCAASTRPFFVAGWRPAWPRSEEHTSELQSLMRISYDVFCLKKNNKAVSTTELCAISTTEHQAT